MAESVLSSQFVLETLREHDRALRELHVQRLGLFGSVARNTSRVDSDIDFLVTFEPGHKTFDNFMGLAFFLEELFQRRVELVTPESLSSGMRQSILAEVEYADFNR